MKDQLVDKLRIAVSEDISKECQVVYILAESRKLLEKYPPDPAPFAFKMYCHWALHIDLTNPGTTEIFLQRVDKFVESFVARNASILLASNAEILEEKQMFYEFAFWDTFRQQFQGFLKAYGLPTALCDEDKRWHDFLRYYARVIEDGTLCCGAKVKHGVKVKRLRFVEKIIVEKGRPRPTNNSAPFDLAWHIVLLDGRALTVDVSAADLPDGSPMLVHGIKLQWEGRSGFFTA
ncbi:MAG: hypothetical protein ABSG10_00900 [Terracidiphilus sp.]|jgi:hypothetical protein